VGEKERHIPTVVEVLEDSGQMPRLAAVERHRLVAAAPSGGLFRAAFEKERERVAQRGLLRGSVSGIGEVALELAQRQRGRLEIGAAGRDLPSDPAFVDVRVPDQAALGEPISTLAHGILDCLYRCQVLHRIRSCLPGSGTIPKCARAAWRCS
jgi:hypothetical protein